MLRSTPRSRGLWLGAVTTLGITGCSPSAQGQQTIVLKPGQNLEAIVAHAPEGTRFRFEPGIYREQTNSSEEPAGVHRTTGHWKESQNEFDRNTYIVADREAEHWTSIDRDAVWQEVAELGLEGNGELIVEQRTPMALSCDRSPFEGSN
jgi:hypothetical protein